MPSRPLLGVGLILLLLRPAWAGTTGGLRGQVIDTAGAPLRGVVLQVTSRAAAVTTTAGPSDAAGRFQLGSLPPSADYVVHASLAGYAPIDMTDLVVEAGRATTLTLTLAPESTVAERVQVRATAPVLDTTARGLASEYSAEFIDNLPILGRNYQEVLSLAPGVTDVDGDGNPNIHGARDTDVGTSFDGVNTTDPLTGKVGMQLNIESIQEIEVKTAGAPAEFGRAQGGFANIVTRSGGNDFEGAFKFYWRGSALDGDGAGIDDPSLHGGVGEHGLRDITFNDYLPFVSFSGPIVRDKAWFFVTLEWIHKEDPVNAVSQAFVTGLQEKRVFAKTTWQVTPTNRLAFILNDDPQKFLNQGLNSLTREEAGYTIEQGGPLLTLKDTAVLSPAVALETTASYFEGRPGVDPNLGPDTNHDGILTRDRNGNGFNEAKERDPGEDYDGDGNFDLWEDTLIRDGKITFEDLLYCDDGNGHRILSPPAMCRETHSTQDCCDEDGPWPDDLSPQHASGDGDRRLTPPGGCEGLNREDVDCDGHLDTIDEDRNGNGLLDQGEDRDADARLDLGLEDRNGNGRLDDTPFPTSLYPYGELRPTPADRDYAINVRNGVQDGPYYKSSDDQRSRGTLRQDLSVFVPDFHGSHDIKGGYLVEREQFERQGRAQPITAVNDPGYRTGITIDRVQHPELHYDCDPYEEACRDPRLGRITAILPISPSADQQADGLSTGLYIQDSWKPHPRVSLSLGVRFDRESATSTGWSYFTPDDEADRADRLQALAGQEVGKDDLVSGNNDGVVSFGITADPVFGAGSLVSDVTNVLLSDATANFTRHRDTAAFATGQAGSLGPGLERDRAIDPAATTQLDAGVQSPEAIRISNNNLSPRLALSWDPAGDSRTKIFGSWGRYYDRLFLSTLVGEQGIETVQRYYVYDRDAVTAKAGDLFPVSYPQTGVPNHHFGTLLSSSPPSVNQVDRNLATPHCDEWIAGFEREVAPETALSVRFVHRRYDDQLQDVDVNHETRIDPLTGALADRIGAMLDAVVQTPDGHLVEESIPSPDGRPDLFTRNPYFNQVLRVGNSNTSEYRAFEVELRRRLARRWQMQASYTYSRAVGSAEDFQSRLGNDPSTVESEFGYLDFDQRHVVKTNAAFFLPGDWQLGVAAQWASGLPYSVVSRFFAHDSAGYQQFRTRYGYTFVNEQGLLAFQGLSRNSARNGSTLGLDLSGRKNFVMGRTIAAVSLEVFNVLNQDELRVHSYEPSRTTTVDASGAVVVPGAAQLDAERPFGRRFQVGFQLQF
jgi:outer membrane receptor protein involved in Fe transport